MERRLRVLEKGVRRGDIDTVTRCADFMYWAMVCAHASVREQESRWQGFYRLIDRFGIDAADVPRAVALALATMALPPQHRAAFLAQPLELRVPFLDSLMYGG